MRNLLNVVCLTLACGQAVAADLPSRAAPPPSGPVAAPVYNWTGIYVGVAGGYGFGTQDPLSLFSNDYNSFNYDANGWLFGGTVGAQIQSGHVVIGIEGDLSWSNISGSGTGPIVKLGVLQGIGTLTSKVDWLSTIRTRIGYAQANWLFYGTFGLAAVNGSSQFTQTVGFTCGTNVPCSSKTSLHAGLTAGGGVEWGLTRHASLKLEYLWVGAGAVNTMRENIVRGGLNWRFGG